MAKELFIFRLQVCTVPTNEKTNYHAVLTIRQGENGQPHRLPQDLSAIEYHPRLRESKEFTTAMKAIQNRAQYCNVRIMLDDDVKKLYQDSKKQYTSSSMGQYSIGMRWLQNRLEIQRIGTHGKQVSWKLTPKKVGLQSDIHTSFAISMAHSLTMPSRKST